MDFWPWIALIAVVSTVAWALLWRFAVPKLLAWRGVDIRRTKFGHAVIFDSEDADKTPIRLLNVGGVYQSVCYVDDDLWTQAACLYHRSFAEAIAKRGGAERVLVLGGGGFSLPKHLIAEFPRMQVDVVEIDPAIIDIAREKFFLDRLEKLAGERLRVVCDDGWAFVRASEKPYDVIVNDAFSGKRPLGPMATDEGAQVVAEHLSPGGLYLANIRSSLEGGKSANLDEAKTAFKKVFAHVYLVPERPEKPRELGYNAFIATQEPLELEGAVEL